MAWASVPRRSIYGDGIIDAFSFETFAEDGERLRDTASVRFRSIAKILLRGIHRCVVTDRELQGETGRIANKARDHVRAVAAWAWENDIIETLLRFPKPRLQRDVSGRQYLSKAELNALYFATYYLSRPLVWEQPHSLGQYWRSAMVLFFNYGLDTGTIWKTKITHEPLLWRHVYWSHESPDRQSKLRSRYGWLFYRRVKTNKTFYRPMNRAVRAHLRRLQPPTPIPDEPIFVAGTARPNAIFKRLISHALVSLINSIAWEINALRFTSGLSSMGRVELARSSNSSRNANRRFACIASATQSEHVSELLLEATGNAASKADRIRLISWPSTSITLAEPSLVEILSGTARQMLGM